MRYDHYQGLSPRARCMFSANLAAETTGREPDARKHVSVPAKVERIETIAGCFKPVAGYLHRYTMVDGHVYEEYIQEQRWCSGPHIFIALKTGSGRVIRSSLWSKARMEKLMSDSLARRHRTQEAAKTAGKVLSLSA